MNLVSFDPVSEHLSFSTNASSLCLFTVSCPTEAPVLPIVLGVVGGILFLGLLILAIIKAFFTMVVSEGSFSLGFYHD